MGGKSPLTGLNDKLRLWLVVGINPSLESGAGISVLYTHKCGSPIQAVKIE